MTEKQFNVFDVDGTIFLEDHKKGSYHIGKIENVDVNCLNDIADRLNELNDENKELRKQLHLTHMASMFSTVKSFKGDVSKRYEYSEETDTIYDTANNYGQYHKILDKKEITMLLNEYETLLNGDVE